MIKFENVKVEGFEPAIRGMRNPKNSWAKSDSGYGCITVGEITCSECQFKPQWCGNTTQYIIGPNDKELMLKLNKGGPVHAKYRRQIVVWVDITAPLYWWKEFDTYKVGTVSNSCSTMHKIHDKEFTLDDFSCEKLFDMQDEERPYEDNVMYMVNSKTCLEQTINALNGLRDNFLRTKDKRYWYAMIQLLPTSYNQKRTISMSYENLASMRQYRKNHKLDEWADSFMEFIDNLPYSWIITNEEDKVIDQGVKVTTLKDAHPYDLSAENKRRILEQPDVEPEFYCFIDAGEIPDFYNWSRTKRLMDLYVDNQIVGRLWSIEPNMFCDQTGAINNGYMLGFHIFDHCKANDLQIDYANGRYTHAFNIGPDPNQIRMLLYTKGDGQ